MDEEQQFWTEQAKRGELSPELQERMNNPQFRLEHAKRILALSKQGAEAWGALDKNPPQDKQ